MYNSTETEVAGYVTLKQVYEIALIKSQDPSFKRSSLKSVCKSIMGSARSIGISVIEK
jgi:large subunit ribosomal protein L11